MANEASKTNHNMLDIATVIKMNRIVRFEFLNTCTISKINLSGGGGEEYVSFTFSRNEAAEYDSLGVIDVLVTKRALQT